MEKILLWVFLLALCLFAICAQGMVRVQGKKGKRHGR